MIKDNTIQLYSSSQVESYARQQKGYKVRKNQQYNTNIYKSSSQSHKDGSNLKNRLVNYTLRKLETLNWSILLIIRDKLLLHNASRQCLAAPAEYCPTTITRHMKDFEESGLITIHTTVKKNNIYTLGPQLRDPIVASYLSRYIPALKKIIPFLFSVMSLLSIPSQTRAQTENVTQHWGLYKDLNLKRDCASPSFAKASADKQEVINITKKKEERRIGVNPKEYKDVLTARTPIPPAKIDYGGSARVCDKKSGVSSIGNVLGTVFSEIKNPANKDMQKPEAVNSIYKVPERKVYTEEEKKKVLSKFGLWGPLEKLKEKLMQNEEWNNGRTND